MLENLAARQSHSNILALTSERPPAGERMHRFWFKSSLFEIEPGEDNETNPRIYGKRLAHWLREKCISLGYGVEDVIPEDWGWCVMCSRKPYMLWIGCANVDDYDTAKEGDPPPGKEDILWTCFVEAEKPLFGRLFKKIDTSQGIRKLTEELKSILEAEPEIKIIEES